MALIEIDGLPINSMVDLSMANCERHNQMVSQSMACHVSWPQRSEHHCHQAWGGATSGNPLVETWMNVTNYIRLYTIPIYTYLYISIPYNALFNIKMIAWNNVPTSWRTIFFREKTSWKDVLWIDLWPPPPGQARFTLAKSHRPCPVAGAVQTLDMERPFFVPRGITDPGRVAPTATHHG